VKISNKLADFEKRTGAQIAVLTIPSLEGESIDGFSMRVVESWKLGRKGVDDGVLFLIVPGERKMRIEAGYGLESKLTDLTSRRILDEVVAPRFRAGDVGGGVEAGVDAIIGVIDGKLDALPPSRSAAMPPFSSWPLSSQIIGVILILVPAFICSALAIGMPGLLGWALCLVVAGGYYYFLNSWFGSPVGIVVAALWTVVFPIIRIRTGKGGIGGIEQIVPAIALGGAGLGYYLYEHGQQRLIQRLILLIANPYFMYGLIAVGMVFSLIWGRHHKSTVYHSSGSSTHAWSSHDSSSSSSSSSSSFSGGGGRFGGGGASSGW
jgi:uncharacterized protein